MRIWWLVAVAAASLVSSCDSGVEKPTEQGVVAPELTSNTDLKPGNGPTSEKIETIKDQTGREDLTASQKNAVRSAEQYLSMTGFSREGLIQQLSSDAGDGYSVSDATAAVDSLSVDWNENAAKSARQYLSMSGFSCKGLIEQLSSTAGDKYTVEQATFGAHQAGAC
jgi:hypothetical protein